MEERIWIVCAGFVLDLILGDPHFLWHPVRGIGTCIERVEKLLRGVLSIREGRELDKNKKRAAGVLLVVIVLTVCTGIPVALLYVAGRLHPALRTFLSCIMCYRLLAMKSLKTESMKVYAALREQDIEGARSAVSMIVGRDTKRLDREGITRAAVETVAENTSDGVIAPLLFLLVLGIPGGFFYKAVNTMDSMVGYKNDAYCYFGTAAARLDDILNYIPSRVAALMMLAAAFLLRLDARNAWAVYRRDRGCHASPNSAQTESVCAGALRIQLAGDAYYFGRLHHKPVIGDALRAIGPEDIRRANSLLYLTSILTLAAGIITMFFLQAGL